MRYKNIIWDWNGTLLDDAVAGVQTLNQMLKKRQLPLIDFKIYKDLFGFPVVDFYKALGFDLQKENLIRISEDFVETYNIKAKHTTLADSIEKVLKDVKNRGMKQYILSALKEDLLEQIVKDFGIKDFFEHLCGSDNIYAAGKVDRGMRMLKEYNISPAETIMIGDTIHDAEVAKALGFDCILYAGGHNSEWRLREKAPVIHEFTELVKILDEREEKREEVKEKEDE